MLKRMSLALIALLSFTASAANLTITEDVNVYLLAGPSTKYRILGTIKAGDAVRSLNEVSGEYSKVEDPKGRQGWVKSEMLANKASFRTLLPQTQSKLADTEAELERVNAVLSELQQRYDVDQQNGAEALNEQRSRVTKQAARINQLEQQNEELNSQLNSIQNEERFVWLKQGGMIAGAGVLVGLIIAYLPRPSRRRKNDQWLN